MSLPDFDRSNRQYDLLHPEVGMALDVARKRAMFIWDTPVWPVNTSMHWMLRQRWFAHGEGEAMLFSLLCNSDSYFLESSQGQLEDILLGMFIHDFGKGLIGDHVVWKTPLDQLPPENKLLITKHVTNGLWLLRELKTSYGIKIPDVTVDVVALHHEKLNGSGGPYHLRGNDIPWHARLAAIVDQLISRLEVREYKNGYGIFSTFSEALDDVDINYRLLYDPQILEHIRENLGFIENYLNKQQIQYSQFDVQWTGWYLRH